ncbi:helix-turn-helix domain-containing protein [Acrocarpospora sp. B8E8]|uniref:MarR family transcriptional regulator n=1 Tax=Acrocarpospora sp. B8E8 TaxID=3153572 RepID=UPI00325EDE9D
MGDSIEATLTSLAGDGATGALRAGRAGTIYLHEGRVCLVECQGTPSVEELLTTSGRISANGVRTTRQAAAGDGGDMLVRRGVLTRGELQLCVLGATLDASFFLFGMAGPKLRFKDGDRHWLGTYWYFDVPALLLECRRRRARLDRAWPSAELDGKPVRPVRRIGSKHVVVSSAQWEILLAADGESTPAELAKKIGLSAYATLVAVRELAAADLLVRPEPATKPEPKPELPRRTDRSGLRPGLGAQSHTITPQTTGDPTDVNLLIRLRDALEALQ